MDSKYKIMGLLSLVTVVILISACIDGGEKKETLSIAGSTTVQPIAAKAAEEFMKKNPGVIVSVQGGGSGTGVKMVAEGSADIGDASRELKETEKTKYPDLKPYAIAGDGIAVVAHPANSVSGLTKQQVQDIFSGKITNFKGVGGPDKEIMVVIREEGSGTRATFEELVMNKGKTANAGDALQKPSNGAAKAAIAGNENAIGYIGLGYVDETVKDLKIDGVTPSTATIKSGAYPISRKLYMITNGEASGLKKRFIDFVLSDEGQEIVEEEGFIKIR
ncbi:MAG: phosphate ABC transporter substrate-binding protein [Candidatus Altiarchaeota archaeon]|nr:phosphate ABC transporter substrate-binding protein [Candidatus Altiarchaeota archaeon]